MRNKGHKNKKGNYLTSKINVFLILHTIFLLLGGQKMDFSTSGSKSVVFCHLRGIQIYFVIPQWKKIVCNTRETFISHSQNKLPLPSCITIIFLARVNKMHFLTRW